MYTYLRQGYRLPTVGVLQVLLNRGITGKKLAKDGQFGPNTKTAVRGFQRPRGLKPDGIVGIKTWPRIISGTGFRILDAVDITDPEIQKTAGASIRRAGGKPTLIGYMSNGIEHLIRELAGRLSLAGEVVLLRFQGHGASGNMGISDGEGYIRMGGRDVFLEDDDMSALTSGTIAKFRPQLRMLAPYFGSYSSVELHGCEVAKGPNGRQLVQQLANIWNVPVSAAVKTQLVGGVSTFRFEGRTYTACPGGISLKQWTKKLSDMPGVTVR